ncbi:MAG: hypothetical protein Q4G35_07520 [Propionibacteriaceae bacterium]|nr:hypothetical protein [Propionibacteriaceae bacterium]
MALIFLLVGAVGLAVQHRFTRVNRWPAILMTLAAVLGMLQIHVVRYPALSFAPLPFSVWAFVAAVAAATAAALAWVVVGRSQLT